ncbi:MAG: hypothetical protein J5643_06570 [Lachnospiraceae bacterium]|nr:hypothetical protein [Lachnospiraceae bacterium]
MKRIKADNRGVALITVVIGVMFCLLLTSTMMRVSLLGLQSREVNNQSSDNFYDAESVVDTVRLNLQHYAAKAWAETTNGTDSENFVKQTYFLLTGTSYPVSGGISLSDAQKTHVIDSLKANAKNGGSILSIGNMETVTGASGKLEGLIIRDVEVKYEHPTTKMVSYVKTDITISAPLYASKKRFPLASYSMFAGSGVSLWNAQGMQGVYGNPNQFGFLEQKGNVYFGYESWDNAGNVTAVTISNRETLILSGENVVINGDVVLTNYSNLQITGTDVEIRGKIYLGTGCHLIVGRGIDPNTHQVTSTNVRCQDIRIGDRNSYQSVAKNTYSKQLGSTVTYPGSPYKCYQSTKNMGVDDFKNSHPKWVDSPASIVYIDWNNVDSAQAFDAVVINGKVKDQQGNNLRVYVDEGVDTPNRDTELDPRPRRKTQNADGTGATYQYAYDDFFIEMVDVAYFEKFMHDSEIYNYAQNNKLEGRIRDEYYNPNSDKNEPSQDGAFTSPNITKRSGEEFASLTYSGVSVNGISNPRCAIVFTASTNSGNGNLVHSGDRPFVLSNNDVEFHVDSTTAEYTGIIITPKKVSLKKDNGMCRGKSLLLLDTTSDHQYLKAFMDEVGKHVVSNNISSGKRRYATVNNLFNGGMKRFYESNGSNTGSNYAVDTAHNEEMNLIDLSNYEKK